MSAANIIHSLAGRGIQRLFKRSAVGAGFFLTVEDRLGIERLLRHGAMQHAPNPELLTGLLRYKLRSSRSAPEPVPWDLVVAGCHLTYRVRGENTRSGVLSMTPTPLPGHVLVPTLLGATLIGVRALQEVPLLRDNGNITSVVVLDVTWPPDRKAA